MKLIDELYEAATGPNNAKLKAEYESILVAARRAASAGDLYIRLNSISAPVQKKLESEGIKVTYNSGGDQRDPYPAFYIISWEKPKAYAIDAFK